MAGFGIDLGNWLSGLSLIPQQTFYSNPTSSVTTQVVSSAGHYANPQTGAINESYDPTRNESEQGNSAPGFQLTGLMPGPTIENTVTTNPGTLSTITQGNGGMVLLALIGAVLVYFILKHNK